MLILLIGKDNKVEEIIEESKFSELGILERTHMEEWVAEYPQILGEDLLTITTEYDKFDKTSNRLDVLAIDTNGKVVVIELKRDIANIFVDLQAIHYAAYCSTLNLEQVVEMMSEYHGKSKDEIESKIKQFIQNDDFSDFDNQPRIILVANDFREETLAAVLWLRDNSLDITCIKLEPYKIEGKIAVKPEIIIPLPETKDFMIQSEQKKIKTKKRTKRQEEYLKFWNQMLIKFNESKPGLIKRKYCQYNYMGIPTGISNVHFEWLFRGRPLQEFLVGLHFENNNYDENLKLLNYFKSRKKEFEDKFPDEEIIFDKKFFTKWTQIYIKRDSGNIDNENLKWGFETMIKLYDTLKPILDEYFQE